MYKCFLGTVLIAFSLASVAADAPAQGNGVALLMTKPLEGIEGREVTMLTVELPPGADSQPHRHNANTFVYVLEGTIVMQVRGGPIMTLSAGQTFYEAPTNVHTVSRNASKTERAKILVVMVKPIGAPILIPAEYSPAT